MFGKKKREALALKIVSAVCEALPAEFDDISRQIEEQCTFFVQTFGDSIIMNQSFLNVAKAISIQAKYLDDNKSFIIDHIFISDFEGKRHKVSIEIHSGLLLGFNIGIDQLEQVNLETICVKNHKLKYRVYQLETLFTPEELEHLIRPDIYRVDLGGTPHYWICDLADGDFAAMDTEKNIYYVSCDQRAITLFEEDLLTFLKAITADRQSGNNSNLEEPASEGEYLLTLQLNARLQPFDRDNIYEAPLVDALERSGCGFVDGAGTGLLENGEVECCELHLCLNNEDEETLETLLHIVEEIGIPKGSFLRTHDLNLPVGRLEGLALYLNGTELPNEVYETSDVNDVIQKINELLAESGEMHSYWQGPQETALYFYGSSFTEMTKKMEAFLAEYPLCQKCRVEQIA